MSGAGRRVVLITARVPPERNGVGDYAYHLGRQLARLGHSVTIVTASGQRPDEAEHGRFRVVPVIPRWNLAGMRVLLRVVRDLRPDVVNVQWVPYLWARRGINFALPFAVLRLKRAGFTTITTAHEAYVPFDTWSRLVTGPVQRLQFLLLAAGSTRILMTAGGWRRLVLRYLPWRSRDVSCVSVGSNIVPGAGASPLDRAAVRTRLGFRPDEIVIAVFSPFSAGKMLHLVSRTWSILRGRHPRLRFVVIGCTADELQRGAGQVRWEPPVQCTGFLPPAGVSDWLWATDLLLAPFDDGMSTRRTSAIAALAHHVPVVSTRGFMTDAHVFEGGPVVLVDVDDEQGFVDAAEWLISEDAVRSALRESSARFFADRFSWPRVTQQFVNLCFADQ
jgi:glycosyltransferase involved in cell wall biosynthesis